MCSFLCCFIIVVFSIASFIPSKELLDNVEEVKSRIFTFSADMMITEPFFPMEQCTEGDSEEIEVGKAPWLHEIQQVQQSSTAVLDLLGGYDSDDAVEDKLSQEDADTNSSEGYLLRLPVHRVMCKVGDKEHVCLLSSGLS